MTYIIIQMFKIRHNIQNSHEICVLDSICTVYSSTPPWMFSHSAVTSVVFLMNVSSKSTHCLIMKNRAQLRANNPNGLTFFQPTHSSALFAFHTRWIECYKAPHLATPQSVHNPFVSFSIIKCLYLGIFMLLICLLLSVNGENLSYLTRG